MRAKLLLVSLVLPIMVGCAPCEGEGAPAQQEQREWAIAVHGGAGTIPRDIAEDRKAAYVAGLERALRLGKDLLEEGGTSLDAVERVIRLLEDDPLFNAGRGAVFNHDAGHELDASIMNGETLACGAVAGVRTVKNPISLARLVMERTPHVLLAANGADAFAVEMDVERVDPAYFDTEERRRSLQQIQERERAKGADKHGTVGVVALDRQGNLAAGTSTGGLTNKLYGRVGDSPIVGAGTYANNATCAISGTGIGEEYIRHGVAYSVSARMEFGGKTLREAAEEVVRRVLSPGDGGIIGVNRVGEIVMVFNTQGMYRGAADSTGRFDVQIWE